MKRFRPSDSFVTMLFCPNCKNRLKHHRFVTAHEPYRRQGEEIGFWIYHSGTCYQCGRFNEETKLKIKESEKEKERRTRQAIGNDGLLQWAS